MGYGSPETDSRRVIGHGDRAGTATDSSQLALSWAGPHGESSAV